MFSHTSENAAAISNVAKRPLKCITLEEKIEVIRTTEGRQLGPTVCRDLNTVPTTVTTIKKNANKI
jgi:hypothetical protein